MTESENPEVIEEEIEALESELDYEIFQNTMDNFLATADVESVYGEPILHGDSLIIPAAEVVAVMGFGVGSGGGEEKGEHKEGGGRGGGGGGRVFSRPVAVIIATPTGVRVEPVIDVTKIALAAWTAMAFMVGMGLRIRNARSALRGLNKGTWG